MKILAKTFSPANLRLRARMQFSREITQFRRFCWIGGAKDVESQEYVRRQMFDFGDRLDYRF
jgi:hypothetical protein